MLVSDLPLDVASDDPEDNNRRHHAGARAVKAARLDDLFAALDALDTEPVRRLPWAMATTLWWSWLINDEIEARTGVRVVPLRQAV